MEERTLPLIGEKTLQSFQTTHVYIFGVGGVGGFVCEALARMGIGEFSLVDYDTISLSNLNRQIIALHSTIGEKKVDVMKQRILDINPKAVVHTYDTFISKGSLASFDFTCVSYIIDCVDNVTAKLEIIETSKEKKIPILSSMGTGNKLDPMKFRITDISKTTVCPLARVIRYELRKREIKDVKVLYSLEESKSNAEFISSVSFVPSVAGLLIAREVVLDLKNKIESKE